MPGSSPTLECQRTALKQQISDLGNVRTGPITTNGGLSRTRVDIAIAKVDCGPGCSTVSLARSTAKPKQRSSAPPAALSNA